MSAISPGKALEMVEARLGRAPQDALEAAVVLEAWAGLAPGVALKLAEQAVAGDQRRTDQGRAIGRRAQVVDKALLAEGAALLIAVAAVALWTRPFGDALGAAVWNDAVLIALPLTLGLQWILRSRYLGRPNGLASLQRDWFGGLLVFAFLAGAALSLGLREQVAILLIMTWVGGPVIVRRGWALAYVLLLVGVSLAVNAGVDPVPILAAAAAITTLGAVLSLTTSEPGHEAAGRMPRAALAGLMGAGIGCVLVADTTIGWGTQGALPAITLVPSAVGSFWGGVHLWRLQEEVPRALVGVPVAEADRPSFRGPAMGALRGSLMRLVVVTAVLSAVALVAVPYLSGMSNAEGSAVAYGTGEPMSPAASSDGLGARSDPTAPAAVARGGSSAQTPGHDQADYIALLLGFGLVALATLLISLLQALGYAWRAVLSVFCGLVGEIALGLGGGTAVPGAGLIFGALVMVIVALPSTISLCLRPGRTLATTMWIQ